MQEELQLMNPREQGPRISISDTSFSVVIPTGAEKYLSSSEKVILRDGRVAERGEADIEFIVQKLRLFLMQFK